MPAPRVGPLGVLSATGAMLYRDSSGNVDEVAIGAAGDILTVVGGVPAWQAASVALTNVFDRFTAADAIFELVNGATNLAAIAARNDRAVLNFADGGPPGTDDNQTIVFASVIPQDYNDATKSLEVRLDWAAPVGIIAGDVVWDVAWEALHDKANGSPLDIDVAGGSFAAAKTVTSTTAGVTGQITRSVLTFTSAEADALLGGEGYRLWVKRDTDDAADTLVGDASLLRVSVAEV